MFSLRRYYPDQVIRVDQSPLSHLAAPLITIILVKSSQYCKHEDIQRYAGWDFAPKITAALIFPGMFLLRYFRCQSKLHRLHHNARRPEA